MRSDKHLAIELRKKGISYNKISKELGIPKSTMHYWFRDLQWSKAIKKKLNERNIRMAQKRMRIISKANKLKWERWREAHRQDAQREFSYLFKDPLFITGLSLYWGEGDSKIENGLVRLSNTDPIMIRLFADFLRYKCNIPKDKMKITLILYPDLNEVVCKKYWSKASNVSLSQFLKTQFIFGRHPTRRLSYGICNIYVASRGLKEKIFTWIKLYQKELKKYAMRV